MQEITIALNPYKDDAINVINEKIGHIDLSAPILKINMTAEVMEELFKYVRSGLLFIVDGDLKFGDKEFREDEVNYLSNIMKLGSTYYELKEYDIAKEYQKFIKKLKEYNKKPVSKKGDIKNVKSEIKS